MVNLQDSGESQTTFGCLLLSLGREGMDGGMTGEKDDRKKGWIG